MTVVPVNCHVQVCTHCEKKYNSKDSNPFQGKLSINILIDFVHIKNSPFIVSENYPQKPTMRTDH